jgi:hypothetical protein
MDASPTIATMAGMINYLTVSLYQGQFTYNHEQAWAMLNDIYNRVSKTPTVAPSVSDIREFYNNIAFLWHVIETDDPDYDRYMRQLRRYIAAATATAATAAATATATAATE